MDVVSSATASTQCILQLGRAGNAGPFRLARIADCGEFSSQQTEQPKQGLTDQIPAGPTHVVPTLGDFGSSAPTSTLRLQSKPVYCSCIRTPNGSAECAVVADPRRTWFLIAMADAAPASAGEQPSLDRLLGDAASQLASLPEADKQGPPLSLNDAIQAPLAALYEDKRKKDGPGSKSKSKAGIQGPDQLRGALMCAEEEKSSFWMFAEVC